MRPSTSGDRATAGWRSSDARKHRTLEDENRKLKKLLAETMLDASTLKTCSENTSSAQLAQTCRDLGYPVIGSGKLTHPAPYDLTHRFRWVSP